MNNQQYTTLLQETEAQLERLRVLYDQYFQGIERRPPVEARANFERMLNTLRRERPKNTALRFRFQGLTQRLNTYQALWTRVLKQIEEGTYKRDLARARARREAPKSVRPAAAPPQAAPASTFSDDDLRRVYESYVQARGKNNERTDNVRFDAVANSIRGMLPKLQAKHEGKRIDFEVVVKNGRVGLKPVAR